MKFKKESKKNIVESLILVLHPILLAVFPVAAVFFDHKIIPYFLSILLILMLSNKGNKTSNFIVVKKYLKPYFLMLMVYILFTVLSIEFNLALKVLERQVSFILIPLLIFMSPRGKQWNTIFFRTFLIIMFSVFVYATFILIQFSYDQADWIEIMKKRGNYSYVQFKLPHLIGVHPTYWSYLLCISNIVLLNHKRFDLQIKRKIIIILFLIFNINLLYLTARTPLFVNVIICLVYIINYFKKVKINRYHVLLILTTLILFTVLSLNLPFLISKIKNIPLDERTYLWPEGIKTISENYYLLGEGLGQTKNQMKEFIISNGDPREHYNEYDFHNQYLTHFFEMGILGLMALIYLLFYPINIIRYKLNDRSLALIQFTVLASLSFFTETHLFIIKGIVLYSLFSSVFLIITINSDEKHA